jgi:type IV pilus assembly protein PilA
METTGSSRFLRILREALGKRTAMAEEEGAESGFTLIELMVVLLIMAILLAIAIPTFLGVRGSAQDRSAQSDLTNAITSGKAIYTNAGTYGTLTNLQSSLQASEPELNFTTGTASTSGPGTAHNVSVYVTTDGYIVILAAESADGRCWFAEDNEEASAGNGGLAGASTARGVSYAGTSTTNNASCSANVGATAPGTGWSSTYPS